MELGSYVGLGFGLGLAAGISPGPLSTLVVTASLARGFPAGARVALAPLVTDLPIVVLSLTLLERMPTRALAVVAGVGAMYLAYLAFATLSSSRAAALARDATGDAASEGRASDVWRGALVNLLNPHPWMFWISVAGPIVVRGWDEHAAHAIAFVGIFYALLVGSKLAIAALVARGRHLLPDGVYRTVLGVTGLALVVLAVLLAVDAFRLWSGTPGDYTLASSFNAFVTGMEVS